VYGNSEVSCLSLTSSEFSCDALVVDVILWLDGMQHSCAAWWARVKYLRAETIAVQRKGHLLSVSERKLIECLVEALADKYFIFAKVGLKSFIEPSQAAKC